LSVAASFSWLSARKTRVGVPVALPGRPANALDLPALALGAAGLGLT
jgi:hypothetical protein